VSGEPEHCSSPNMPGAGMKPSAVEGVRNAHAWFEVNSGWAPPTDETLIEWLSDGVCRCPDECLVAPDECCRHGLASWWLILQALDADHEAGDVR
jgi:hypothetical protein